MRLKTISSQLFIYYSALVVLLVLIFTGVVYAYVSGILVKRAEDTLEQLVDSFSNELDGRFAVMNETSIRVAYSNLVKDRFDSYRSRPEPISNFYDQRALRDIFIAIMGPLQPVAQINLYDFQGTVVGAGRRTYSTAVDVDTRPWFRRTFDLGGSKHITAPYRDEETGTFYLSLCRVYYDNANEAIGIIEIRQDYSALFGPFDRFTETPPPGFAGSTVFVMNSDRELVYPLPADLTSENRDLYSRLLSVSTPSPPETPYRTRTDITSYVTSEYTGFTVVISGPIVNTMLPVRSFSRVVAVILALFLVLALFLSYILAKRLTLPIDRIHANIKALDFDTVPDHLSTGLDSGFNELEDLYNSFNQMSARLKRSIDDLITAKSQEMNAHLLALQSQMNPHFLYNTISIISILAEDEKTDDIGQICESLSSMLRYISSASPELVPMSVELDHTMRYLQLMEYRYEENIEYAVDIPRRMLDIPIPKLVIQPIVENWTKYGIHTSPPWRLDISGETDEGTWRIDFIDNGPGFDPTVLEDLETRIAGMEFDGKIHSLHVEGMGIMNIYARLRLLYADKARFSIGNASSGGARIVIGGSSDPGVR